MKSNINPNRRRSRSQKDRILIYLKGGGTLTPLQALDLFGTTKLATRISELIDEGHTEIEKHWVWIPSRDGNDMIRVKRYSIAPENRPAMTA